ncbi:putative phosphoglycerate/bisphosphoglycerate mutase [Thiomonas arsenitoxydans]|uniref:Phosphoglycerate/bisphosphoglycerate mutase n=1 Tax=Thiomonas arsenitoxydans (strain DSM 22701 / CIP 110005 / 3As) TaxID=426114 RepID=D6CKN6_THIA3|nr:histidine phosphatase family protein [Thiomonas arsenitoxydans]CAZ87504.1 Putative phosphoglycerate/bisphosphoglycerate mutase [Thiomonas arsenitoxydans]CQR27172.1 putative phosphoglycerate/bisphosphoglycerate mutase [Thiomonas arsenitoxydans]CQR29729.1 putative phosphoglycerate/bisphosphoglycerate mutase [Thiomonas arsenitoxydans]CQR29738.1 putative phosphoglycerate/bisphosphoglycerate mutase [Thiomonas arsenitoxydans]CQR32805.1 putative phosphoglycerate/bisphosphoglycerate mutase [Thiomon
MPTRILLVRHGETGLTLEDRFAGSNDISLSNEGREQAASLGIRLSSVSIAAVYASPMARTLETARIIAGPHNLPVQVVDALREIDYGNWEGLTRDEVTCRFPQAYSLWEEDPLLVAPEGGESGLSVIHRALPIMREIIERHRHQTVLVVSHKGTNRLLVSSLLGLDARGYRERLDQSPAALTILDFMNEVRPRLKLFNDVSHYQSYPEREIAERTSKWWRPTVEG